jgi:hypothetical protein
MKNAVKSSTSNNERILEKLLKQAIELTAFLSRVFFAKQFKN